MVSNYAKAAVLAVAILTPGCNDDDQMGPEVVEATRFSIRIENISNVYDLHASGVFNTPEGAAAPGPLGPGSAYSFRFSAAPGQLLSFATMFVQSNDLFYAPDGAGITLYDEAGNPLSGDITSQIQLWDAGTEMDQEPGLGVDQAPRQTGADVGGVDGNTAVRIAEDTFGNLPDVAAVIQVTLTYVGGREFVVRIENISGDATLGTSDGGTAVVLLAPGVFAVGTGIDELFADGAMDRGEGLEALAEDGNPGPLAGELAARTGLTSPLAPGVWATHMLGAAIFRNGSVDRGQGLEALAEDGNPGPLGTALPGSQLIVDAGVFNTPEGAAGPGPLLPGNAYMAEFEAEAGAYLSLATMLVQTNDLFFAPDDGGIALFNGNTPLSGDITAEFSLWDAGTEINQIPGVGADQAPRQGNADTGETEGGFVQLVNDGFLYPDVGSVIRVTITPLN